MNRLRELPARRGSGRLSTLTSARMRGRLAPPRREPPRAVDRSRRDQKGGSWLPPAAQAPQRRPACPWPASDATHGRRLGYDQQVAEPAPVRRRVGGGGGHRGDPRRRDDSVSAGRGRSSPSSTRPTLPMPSSTECARRRNQGLCTLRAAVQEAEHAGGGHIVLSAGIGDYRLTIPAGPEANANLPCPAQPQPPPAVPATARAISTSAPTSPSTASARTARSSTAPASTAFSTCTPTARCG